MTDSPREDRAVAHSMALLSTLSTAVAFVRAMRERRHGCDPSEQQSPADVLPSLLDQLCSLDDHLVTLRTSLVAAERDLSRRVTVVRTMHDVILLGELRRDLHGLHQRLMSLYPLVDDELVECARRIHRTCGALLEDDEAAPERLVLFIDETAELLATIRTAMTQTWTAL